jgi:hypothetical protein
VPVPESRPRRIIASEFFLDSVRLLTGLGRKAEAIAEGKRACELLPLSRDSWEGPSYVLNLAIIYTWVAEPDLALEQLEILARPPAGKLYGQLMLQPDWDPLRKDPRFQQLIASPAPKPGVDGSRKQLTR